MASVSVSHLIIFIASIVVAASVAGVLTNGVSDVSQSLSQHSVDVAKKVRTNVAIISDAGATVYNRSGNDNVTLLVKNTGEQPIPADPSVVDVVSDGGYVSNDNLTVVGSSTGTWRPGQVARLTFHEPLSPGDHRVKIVVNGDSEVFRFHT